MKKYKPFIVSHHAHLVLGTIDQSKKIIIEQLQTILCGCNKTKPCLSCTQIQEEQHPSVLWTMPENNYTLQDIENILQAIQFKRDKNSPFFIIIQQAHQLTNACINRLLKHIEEPSEGYYFILLASRTDTLLETLISRCFVHTMSSLSSIEKYESFMQAVINFSHIHAATCFKMIETLSIKEQETKEIIDLLIQKYHHQLKTLHQNKNHNPKDLIAMLDIITILKQALNQLPPAGSTKIFWKNMFLLLHDTIKNKTHHDAYST